MTKKKLPPVNIPEEPKQEPEFQVEKYWSVSIGFYPGILLGMRTYEEPTFSTHVIYLPFIDIALEIDK
jgi:hypothetical protein